MPGSALIARLTRCVAAAVAVGVVIAGCGSQPVRGQGTYTVKSGDTLYSIAWRHGLDYREVATWNGIGRDFLIRPGQVLYLVPSSRTARTQARPAAPTARPAPVTVAASVRWSWPVEDAGVTRTQRPNSGEGLTLTGTLGQAIRAAADGSVVYVGSGLLGYGQLVIIKHNDTYLSAYAHTQSVLVREGDQAKSGQPIATMGEGPGQRPMLYFEIRINGQPADPLRFLPPRPG